jgi:hypothetical protein
MRISVMAASSATAAMTEMRIRAVDVEVPQSV